MSKFILIDNSIKDYVGHYYQYAIHCLSAAKNAGYDTYLITNKKFVGSQNFFKVIPVYRNSFWENSDIHDPAKIHLFRKIQKSAFRVLFYVIYKFFGSIILNKFVYGKKISEFSKDSEQLFDNLPIKDGDVIFIPTSGAVELLGLLKCVKKNTTLKRASWHMLFRRNLYGAQFDDNTKRFLSIHPLRYACNAISKVLKNKVYFYTDSDGLSEQYSKFGLKFETLPIPHTSRHDTKRNSDFVKITYLGDARTEKGYQYLPHVVGDLWTDYVKDGKVLFDIQSNYNIPKGETPIVVARNQLQSFSNDRVNLLMNPLSMEEYQNLLLSADILLLPYDANAYYVRTSGIVAEALSCGIPVVVPAGTWLSQQFISEVYLYHQKIQESFDLLYSFDDNIDLQRKIQNKKSKVMEKKLTIDEQKKETIMNFHIAESASHVLVELYFNLKDKASFLMEILQLNSQGMILKKESKLVEKSALDFATSLIPVDDNVDSIKLAFKDLYSESTMKLSKISVNVLKTKDPDKKIPLSIIGIVYDDPYDISKKIKDVIDNYDHYKESALAYSENYYLEHNSDALVKRIIKNA